MANTYPPLVTAKRDRLLTSPVVTYLVSSGGLGATNGIPWVFVDYSDDGRALAGGIGLASVTLYQRAKQWAASNNTARWPTIGVDVIATGPADKPDGQWQARAVAQALIDWLDDPARERQTGSWSNAVYVSSLRWDGSLSIVEMENQNGVYRAEFSLEFELV